MKILGVRIDGLGEKEVISLLAESITQNKVSLIFTPNPEMIVKANQDKYFLETLNRGTINLCDGFGIRLAALFKSVKIKRLTGVDFMISLCRFAEKSELPIFLLGGGKSEVVEKTENALINNFPKLIIRGKNSGPIISEGVNGELVYDHNLNNSLIAEINRLKPSIIFVAFGMGKQEKWLVENIEKIPSIRIGMGVGGAFDFLSQNIKRAPLLMRYIGLEWAYRLVKQPSRFRRIFNATIKFIYLLITKE